MRSLKLYASGARNALNRFDKPIFMVNHPCPRTGADAAEWWGMKKSKTRESDWRSPETDSLLWLEEVEGEKALDWVRAQNDRAKSELESDPHFKAFHEAALKIVNSRDRIPAPSLLPGRVSNFWQDQSNIRGIWRRSTLQSYLSGAPDWELILDFDVLAETEGENWVFAGATSYAPLHQRTILSLSRGGSDAAVRREFLIDEGRFVENGFNIPEAKGAVAWVDENTLLAAIADKPENATSSGYPRLIRQLARGGSIVDAPVLFEGKKTDIGVWPSAVVNRGETYHFITRAITFFESEFYWMTRDGEWRRLELPKKAEIAGVLDGRVIVTIQKDWRRGISKYCSGDVLAVSLKTGAVEKVFRPNKRQAVSSLVINENAILAEILDKVVGRVIRLERRDGKWRPRDVKLPGEGVTALSGVNPYGDDFFIDFESPSEPPALYYLGAEKKPQLVMRGPDFFDAEGVVMKQRFAKSTDGEKIPYFIIGRQEVIKNGRAPTIQYGYGGFEVPSTPGYSGVMGKLWLERGGLYVIANIRGGGEFGPKWHQAALKERRQQGFDDFFAVSEDLIRSGVASPKKLGAYGGSNGGLLMGVALTQRPDLYAGLAIGVPLLDMLRYSQLLAGASWIGEYGDPAIPDERSALLAYSPYHNLTMGRAYPKPFFFTSTKDDRVHPGHARKMAARMAELGYDFLYYENIEGGHGAAANQIQAAYRAALQYVYFTQTLMGE